MAETSASSRLPAAACRLCAAVFAAEAYPRAPLVAAGPLGVEGAGAEAGGAASVLAAAVAAPAVLLGTSVRRLSACAPRPERKERRKRRR